MPILLFFGALALLGAACGVWGVALFDNAAADPRVLPPWCVVASGGAFWLVGVMYGSLLSAWAWHWPFLLRQIF
jgi:hypothetical protein